MLSITDPALRERAGLEGSPQLAQSRATVGVVFRLRGLTRRANFEGFGGQAHEKHENSIGVTSMPTAETASGQPRLLAQKDFESDANQDEPPDHAGFFPERVAEPGTSLHPGKGKKPRY